MNELRVTNPILLHTGGIIDLSDQNRPDEIQKNPQDVISVQPHGYFGTSLFGTTMLHWYKNVFCGHTILDYRKIDKFKLSIRKVPKTSDYRFLADYSDNQLAKSLKRFEIRWVT